ncbi:MAG: phytanoyl-CoA dioxygenase family protein [Saprospiraceae bacterium]|nr:phytanoyl-CoA dioxygenase family protein [Saprospiraceae bacterium]
MENSKRLNVQKKNFDKNGFLIIRNALSRTEIELYNLCIDKLYLDKKELILKRPFSVGLDWKNIVSEDHNFINLIDHPSTFSIVLKLLGYHIQLAMSHAIIRPPGDHFKGFIHTDGGQAMRKIEYSSKGLNFQIKVQYFLTDVKEKDSGNFIYFPGSHKNYFDESKENEYLMSNALKQLKVNAGDVVIFSHLLWHGATINRSLTERKSLVFVTINYL